MSDLPARPSLEHLRKQAKRLGRTRAIPLALAQREIAADHGFASWPRLVRHVRAASLTGLERALALADPASLALALTDPDAARRPVAGVAPLIALLRDSTGAPSDVRRCASALLDAGADPSSTTPSDDGEWELSAVYFAVERRDLTLVELLRNRGAVDDDDAFYHACEQGDPAYLEVLHATGFEDMVNHKLDFEDALGLQWFLDRGVDLDAHGSLHWAIARGRGVELLELLLDAGADPDLPHPDIGVVPLEAAARCGHLAAYELLERRGARAVEPSSSAATVLAIARGESTVLPDEPPPLPGFPGTDYTWILGQLALFGRTEVVAALIDSGLHVDSRGWSNFTPLDQAAMHGRVDTVRLLVERGADLQDCAFGDDGPTPLDCAVWGWSNNRAADGDYLGTVELLVAAGAPTRHRAPTGHEGIDALLRERARR